MLAHLYRSLILPLLTYCSSIWSPYQQTYIDKLERVQHKLLYYLAQKSWYPLSPTDYSYDHLHEQFYITTLQNIHSQHGACLAFELIHRLVNSPENFDGFRSRTFPYNLGFSEPLCRHNISSKNIFHSSSNHLKCVWNLLPSLMRSSETLRTFKKAVSSLGVVGILSIV